MRTTTIAITIAMMTLGRGYFHDDNDDNNKDINKFTRTRIKMAAMAVDCQ